MTGPANDTFAEAWAGFVQQYPAMGIGLRAQEVHHLCQAQEVHHLPVRYGKFARYAMDAIGAPEPSLLTLLAIATRLVPEHVFYDQVTITAGDGAIVELEPWYVGLIVGRIESHKKATAGKPFPAAFAGQMDVAEQYKQKLHVDPASMVESAVIEMAAPMPADDYSGLARKLLTRVPALITAVDCPACSKQARLWDMIQHVNDTHTQYSREDIAAWLESLRLDLTVHPEPPPVDALARLRTGVLAPIEQNPHVVGASITSDIKALDVTITVRLACHGEFALAGPNVPDLVEHVEAYLAAHICLSDTTITINQEAS